jgi:transposase-like protein
LGRDLKPDATSAVAAEPLEPPQTKALELFLEGHAVEEVALKLGIHRSTLWRWRTDTNFAARLLNAQQARVHESEERLQALAHDAISYLGTVLRNANEPTPLRLKAASEILNRGGLDSATNARDRATKQAETLLSDVLVHLFEHAPETEPVVMGLLTGSTIPQQTADEEQTLTVRFSKKGKHNEHT